MLKETMRVSTVVLLAVFSTPTVAIAMSGYDLSLTVVSVGSNEPIVNAVVSAPSALPPAPVNTEISQKDRAFHPHILVVPVGSSVDFPNRDNTQHHVYSFSPAKTFNIELYADRPAAPIVFDTPGIVELGCNIHDHMQGFVVVTDTANFGQTNEHGQVTLTVDPRIAGDDQSNMTLKIWHPRLADNAHAVFREIKSGSRTAVVTLDLEPAPVREGSLDRLQQRFRKL
jgi:plastocyanin